LNVVAIRQPLDAVKDDRLSGEQAGPNLPGQGAIAITQTGFTPAARHQPIAVTIMACPYYTATS